MLRCGNNAMSDIWLLKDRLLAGSHKKKSKKKTFIQARNFKNHLNDLIGVGSNNHTLHNRESRGGNIKCPWIRWSITHPHLLI